jgi:predicted DNA-binding protein (UPF0251 family)
LPRPIIPRRVLAEPKVTYFKPAGIRLAELEENSVGIEEFEAIRLADLESMEQENAAEKMGISQPTFHRLLVSARKKIADAIVKGKAIRIEGGHYSFARGRRYRGGR